MRTRLWLGGGLLLLALLVVGAVLQAFNQLLWQLSTVLPYGLVGPVALMLVLGAALLLAQLSWPWLRGLVQEGRRQRSGQAPTPQAPSNRRDAASQQLEAIESTLERVRDSVAREALQQEQQRMAAELQRGDLTVVLFGAGSSGKTSLIRALLQEGHRSCRTRRMSATSTVPAAVPSDVQSS